MEMDLVVLVENIRQFLIKIPETDSATLMKSLDKEDQHKYRLISLILGKTICKKASAILLENFKHNWREKYHDCIQSMAMLHLIGDILIIPQLIAILKEYGKFTFDEEDRTCGVAPPYNIYANKVFFEACVAYRIIEFICRFSNSAFDYQFVKKYISEVGFNEDFAPQRLEGGWSLNVLLKDFERRLLGYEE